MNRNHSPLLLVSGQPGAGKTTLCIRVAALLREAGVSVGGLVSPARMEGGRKTGILARSLASGEERLLAEAAPGKTLGWERIYNLLGELPREGRHQTRLGAVPSGAEPTITDRTEADAVPPSEEHRFADRVPGWRFDEQVLRWGAGVIQLAAACDVLVVDELGPLELRQGRGWLTALDILAARRTGCALVVVRPSLVDEFRARFSGREIEVVSAESNPERLVKRCMT